MNAKSRLLHFVLAILAALSSASWGINLETYDLDSLSYMSTQVVEGTVVTAESETLQFKVRKVLSGDLKEGDTITVAATHIFRLPREHGHFGAGDKLWLFLVEAKSDFSFNPPLGSWIPVPSGIKVNYNGTVSGFEQFNNPGPYELLTAESEPKAQFQKPEDFRESLKASIESAKQLKQQWAKDPTAAEIPALLKLLQTRQAYWDKVGEEACRRLVKIGDMDALLNACESDHWQFQVIAVGFASPDGRDFLQKKFADTSVSRNTRMTLAAAFTAAGADFWSSAQGAPAGPLSKKGETDKSNGNFLKRIAQFAVQYEQDEELSGRLIRSIRNSPWYLHPLSSEVRQDLENAFLVLKPLYQKTKYDGIKYETELMVQDMLPGHLRELKPIGDLISGKLDFDSSDETPPKSGFVNVKLYCERKSDKDGTIALRPVVESENGVRLDVHLKVDITSLQKGEALQISDSIKLPPNLPHGKYKFFYEVVQDQKVVGRIYGFTKEL